MNDAKQDAHDAKQAEKRKAEMNHIRDQARKREVERNALLERQRQKACRPLCLLAFLPAVRPAILPA